MATDDENLWMKGLKEIVEIMPELLKLPTPTHVGKIIHSLPKKLLGNDDPYRKVKIEQTQKALQFYSSLKNIVKDSDDPLLTAIKIATAGNTIDYVMESNFDIGEIIEEMMQKNFVINDYAKFQKDINNIKEIMYLVDNAGETVFDKILIEELNKRGIQVLYAVRGSPIINDATEEDAKLAGIDKIAKIINSGTNAPGVILEYCNTEFCDLFYKSKLIISKGQGNYEALSDINAPIYFIFKVKCQGVAKHLNLSIGDMVFMRQKALPI